MIEQAGGGHTIGSTVAVTFVAVGNKSVEGKVDTGATTSSLHATNISIDKASGQVGFACPSLSNNMITMALAGTQDVSSADGGDQARPMVKMDVEIDGVPIRGAVFNLNDRSNMDVMVLVGQNILKAGGFLIDVQKDEQPVQNESEDTPRVIDSAVVDAVKTIVEHSISIEQFFQIYKEITDHKE